MRWRWPSLLAVATRKLLLRPPRLPTLLLLLLLLLPLLTLPLRPLTLLLRPQVLRRLKLRSSNRNAQAFSIRNRVGSPALLVDPPGFLFFGPTSGPATTVMIR